MMPPGVAHLIIPVIIGISIVLMLVRLRNIAEVYWISAGVVLLLALRLISVQLAGRALVKALDVCFFLIGMMLLSELPASTESSTGCPRSRFGGLVAHA